MEPQLMVAKGLPANMMLEGNGVKKLPAYHDAGIFTTRWKLSFKERLFVLFTGNIWLNVMHTHPPIRLDVEAPFRVVKTYNPFEIKKTLSEQMSAASVENKDEPGEDDVLEPEDLAEKEKRSGDDDWGFFS